MCWCIVVKEKPTVGSPFSGAFHSDHIPEATKDVNVHFFIHSTNSCKLYQGIYANCTSEFGELFEATTYFEDLCRTQYQDSTLNCTHVASTFKLITDCRNLKSATWQ
jgi:hypothetical protein